MVLDVLLTFSYEAVEAGKAVLMNLGALQGKKSKGNNYLKV